MQAQIEASAEGDPAIETDEARLVEIEQLIALSRIPPRHMTHLGADLSADDCVVRNLLLSHIHLFSIH
ncbi:hypothetical protein [Agrobacterium tumefaciens]|uniref:Uncharacterized protein n=1 Tax=Agrobacterium tumefaciens TaxID=358 RepID=A0AAW8M0M3_AGRTU|nr:hypothetical protein [Agrobacterium tumefaciens]MBP2567960.1 hypothetical protein [Agrobacterium tumefaciens]MDP9874070.1 hypothetical protein [Agrobacterium tumefaciens]MDP9978666.1 hypothetical protein [Agrobacterium tumefaciens]MDR6704943.1 hypothetical protein [Agrobacterium tumefaciens]